MSPTIPQEVIDQQFDSMMQYQAQADQETAAEIQRISTQNMLILARLAMQVRPANAEVADNLTVAAVNAYVTPMSQVAQHMAAYQSKSLLDEAARHYHEDEKEDEDELALV